MAMSRLTPEEQAEQDLQRWRQGGLTPAASRMQTSLFPATGWRSPAPPPQRGAVEWAEEESEGGRTREAPHTRYTAPQPAAAPYGTRERPGTAGWDGSRSGSTGGWAEPESGRVQLAAYQPIAGKQPTAGKQPLAKPAPTGPSPLTPASPAQSGAVGSGGAKPSVPPALSAEERAQLQALDREIAEVEALSWWHHDQIYTNRAQSTPIPDSDPRSRQHLHEIQQVLNPQVLALQARRERLLAGRAAGTPGGGQPGGSRWVDRIERYSGRRPPKVKVTRYSAAGPGAPAVAGTEEVQPPSERELRVLGGGKYPVYDPFHNREAREKNLLERGLDLPAQLFAGSFLEEKEKTAKVYHGAQLQGLIPLAPLLAGPGEKDYQTKRQFQIRQLDDLKEQIRRFYYAVLLPVSDPHEFDAYKYQGEHPTVHVRDPKQVAKEKAAIAKGFTPERFEQWARRKQYPFTPYQRSAIGNLMAWHEITSDRFSAEMDALSRGVIISALFWEVGGTAGKTVLGPLERQGLKLLGRFAPKGAAAVEKFGATAAGKYLQHGAHQGAVTGAGQFTAEQLLSGHSAERIAAERNRLVGLAKEIGNLGQGAITHGVIGYFLGAGMAGGTTVARAALSPVERATVAAIERYQLRKQVPKPGGGKPPKPGPTAPAPESRTEPKEMGQPVGGSERPVPKGAGGTKATKAPGLSRSFREQLDLLEAKAQARLERTRKSRRGGILASTGGVFNDLAEELPDWAVIGGVRIARGALDQVVWAKEMTQEFGEGVRPHLERIWAAAHDYYEGELLPLLAHLRAAEGPVLFASKEVKQMRIEKKKLDQGNFAVDEVRKFVASYFEKERKKYESLRHKNTVFLAMPSTSGRNTIAFEFARRLQEEFGGEVVRDSARPLSKKQAKLKNVKEKLESPSRYDITADLSRYKGRHVILVDDVLNTGDSLMGLRQALQDAGLDTAGIAVLGAAEENPASARDLARLAKRVAEATGKDVTEIRRDIYQVFRGGLRKFTGDWERALNSHPTWAEGFYEVVHREAAALRANARGVDGVEPRPGAGGEPAGAGVRVGGVPGTPGLGATPVSGTGGARTGGEIRTPELTPRGTRALKQLESEAQGRIGARAQASQPGSAPAPLAAGTAVEYRTREGTLKLTKVVERNPDGTYRLSNGVKTAPLDRLRAREVEAEPNTPDATPGSGSGKKQPAIKPAREKLPRQGQIDPPPAGERRMAARVQAPGERPDREATVLPVGTWVDYFRKDGPVRRSRIAGVNADGTYQLRNGIARAQPQGLRVLQTWG